MSGTETLFEFPDLVSALWTTIRDSDFRPRYQRQYQRLWHDSNAEVARLRTAYEQVRGRLERAIEACPTKAYHDTHRYCPSCPWQEGD